MDRFGFLFRAGFACCSSPPGRNQYCRSNTEWKEEMEAAYESSNHFRLWPWLDVSLLVLFEQQPMQTPLAKLAQNVGLIFTAAATHPDAMLCIKCAYLLCTERRPSVHKALSVSFDGQFCVLFSLRTERPHEFPHRKSYNGLDMKWEMTMPLNDGFSLSQMSCKKHFWSHMVQFFNFFQTWRDCKCD